MDKPYKISCGCSNVKHSLDIPVDESDYTVYINPIITPEKGFLKD